MTENLSAEEVAERLEDAKNAALADERVTKFIAKRNAAAKRSNPFRRQPNESEKL